MSLVSKIKAGFERVRDQFNTEKAAREAGDAGNWVSIPTNSINAAAPITDFPDGKVSVMTITNAGNTGYPDVGSLIVDRRNPDPNHCFRVLHGYGSNNLHYQRNTFSGWNPWRKQITSKNGAITDQLQFDLCPTHEDPTDLNNQNSSVNIGTGKKLFKEKAFDTLRADDFINAIVDNTANTIISDQRWLLRDFTGGTITAEYDKIREHASRGGLALSGLGKLTHISHVPQSGSGGWDYCNLSKPVTAKIRINHVDTKVQFGLGDAVVSNIGGTAYRVVEYDSALSPNFRLKVNILGTETIVDTGVAVVENTDYILWLKRVGGITHAKIYNSNGVELASVTASTSSTVTWGHGLVLGVDTVTVPSSGFVSVDFITYHAHSQSLGAVDLNN